MGSDSSRLKVQEQVLLPIFHPPQMWLCQEGGFSKLTRPSVLLQVGKTRFFALSQAAGYSITLHVVDVHVLCTTVEPRYFEVQREMEKSSK